MEKQSESVPQIVPIEYAGKWIAWNAERTKIVASGATLHEAIQAVAASGESNPIYAKAPRADVRFVGGKR